MSKNPADKGKISLEECKNILNSKGRKYTEEQVLQIRDLLYQFAEIERIAYKQSLAKRTALTASK